jgi:hypothetical protein
MLATLQQDNVKAGTELRLTLHQTGISLFPSFLLAVLAYLHGVPQRMCWRQFDPPFRRSRKTD